ncbi:hypothetical protein NDU88_006717, partial [Pleurodeles waltl]
SEFLQKTISHLSNDLPSTCIWGGDMNCVPQIDMDRSHTPITASPITKNSQMLRQWISDRRLTDTWRHLHPRDQEYSYYSPVHLPHTRIDLILTSQDITHRIT